MIAPMAKSAGLYQLSVWLILLSPALSSAATDDFASVRGEWSIARADRDTDGFLDTIVTTAGIQWFFQDVAVAEQPKAEAAFLQHVGYIDVYAGEVNASYLDRYGTGPSYGASGVLAWPGQAALLSMSYDYFSVDIESAGQRQVSKETVALSAGAYVTSSGVLLAQWEHGELTTRLSGSLLNQTQWESYGLRFKQVALRSAKTAFGLELAAGRKQFAAEATTSASRNTVAGVQLVFYPDLRLQFMLALTQERGDYAATLGDAWVLSTQLALQGNSAVELRYEQFNADTDAKDSAAVTLELSSLF